MSFLSSSSTLGLALDLMEEPVGDLVGRVHPVDEEEKRLMEQLQVGNVMILMWLGRMWTKT